MSELSGNAMRESHLKAIKVSDRKLIESIQEALKNKKLANAINSADQLSKPMLEIVSQTIAMQAVLEGDFINYSEAMDLAKKSPLVRDEKIIFLVAISKKDMVTLDDLFSTIGNKLNLLELSMLLPLTLAVGRYDFAKEVIKRLRRPFTVDELETVLKNGLGDIFVNFDNAVEIITKIGRPFKLEELKILLKYIVCFEDWDDFYKLEEMMPEKHVKSELKKILPEYVLQGELQICKFIVEKLGRNLTKDELIAIMKACKEKEHRNDLSEARSIMEDLYEE